VITTGFVRRGRSAAVAPTGGAAAAAEDTYGDKLDDELRDHDA
jgi:hypothetical protein